MPLTPPRSTLLQPVNGVRRWPGPTATRASAHEAAALQRPHIEREQPRSPLNLILALCGVGQVSTEPRVPTPRLGRTFSFTCSANTTAPRMRMAAPRTIVTQGIQSPGCRYNSFLHVLGSLLPSGW